MEGVAERAIERDVLDQECGSSEANAKVLHRSVFSGSFLKGSRVFEVEIKKEGGVLFRGQERIK